MTNLLTQEDRDELTTRLRAGLLDASGSQIPSTPEFLHQALFQAMRDVSRHSPKQEVYEVEVRERSHSRALTPAFGAATAKPGLWYVKDWEQVYGSYTPGLAMDFYKPIRPFSEHVWTATAAGASVLPTSGYFTRGTDYEINYASGAIYIPSSSSIVTITSGRRLWISYEVDWHIVDLAPIYELLGQDAEHGLWMMRVTDVEYPLGRTPRKMLPFSVWGDLLFPHWGALDMSKPPQARHIAIHTEVDHWLPHSTGALGGPGWHPTTFFHAPAQEMIDLLVDLYDQMYQSVDFSYGDLYDGALLKTQYKDALVSAVFDLCRHSPLQLTRDYIGTAAMSDYIDISDINLLSGVYRSSAGSREHLKNCPVRVVEVEYPGGQIPRRVVPHQVWGDNLYLPNDTVRPDKLVRVHWEGCGVLQEIEAAPTPGTELQTYYAKTNGRLSFWYGTTAYVVAFLASGPMIYRVDTITGNGLFTRIDEANEPGAIASYSSLITLNTDARLASDGKTIHIICMFTSGNTRKIQYSTFDMLTELWVSSEVIATFTGGSPGFGIGISLDSADKPFVLYMEGPLTGQVHKLWEINKTSGVWSTPVLVLTDTGGDRSLTFLSPDHDSLDNLHVVTGTGLQYLLRDEHMKRTPAGVWSQESTTPFAANKITIIKKMWIDQSDVIHVIGTRGIAPADSYHFYYDGSWNSEMIVAATTPGTYISMQMVVTDDNITRVLYVPNQTTREVFEIHKSPGGSWSAPVSVATLTDWDAAALEIPAMTANQSRTGIIDWIGIDYQIVRRIILFKSISTP